MGNCFGKAGNNKIERVHHTSATHKPTSKNTPERSNGKIKVVVGVGNKGIIREEYGRGDGLSLNIGQAQAESEAASSSGGGGNKMKMKMMMEMPPKMFTLDELKSATRNFRPDTVLGEGGFGRVFKGWVDEKTLRPSKVGVGIPVAVKKSNPDSQQGLQEWQSEVKFLGKLSHPNLVKLLGYCWEENQFLLVYEYMQKGSLESHLFRKGPEALSWDIRLKVAIGAAKGLAFLHTSEKTVIYRDFKSSNILLDGDYNAKLSDFGLAKLGPPNGKSHVTTRVLGTYGYAAPEYMATGHLYVKSDVYGFGVVLLELLTGLIALDTNRPSGEQSLLEWTKSSLSDKRKLEKIMDPRISKQYSMTAAFLIAKLILTCLEEDPKNRPSMEQVLETLENAQSIKPKPKVKKANAVHQTEENPISIHSRRRPSPTPSPANNNHYKSSSRTHSPRKVLAQHLPRPIPR